jgi:hypothetical protein
MSLHLTVGVLSTTHRDLVSSLLCAADLDRPLPLGFHRNRETTARGVLDAVGTVFDHLGRVDASEWAAEYLADRPSPGTAFAHYGRLRNAVESTRIGLNTQIAWTDPMVFVESCDDPDRVLLHLSGRSLTVPPAMVPVVELLAVAEAPVRVADLP